MKTPEQARGTLRAWGAAVGAAALLMLALPVAARATPALASANWAAAHMQVQVQRDLVRTAIQHPAARVALIVQTVPGRAGAEALAVRLGGRITNEMPFIHAFAVTLPAGAVARLASSRAVRWVSRDGAVVRDSSINVSGSTVQQADDQSIGASGLWTAATPLQGQGIGVAVVDSGLANNADFSGRVLAQVNLNPAYHHHTSDLYGHGTHVAGIIAGNGANSNGAYVGIAPQANLVNVRVSDDNGSATVSDVVNGLQWIFTNASQYNIRVVNLSLNSTVADSYQVDPLDAAVETLWNAGIVVVVSAGNNGSTNAGVMYAPADDPFVITVGAVDDHGTVSTSDDTLATFSAFGTVPVSTTSALTAPLGKPDLVAPGVNIISCLASAGDTLALAHPDHVVNGFYFRMSGTSMAAPIVAGAVALLLQSNPNLTPNQVKYRLVTTATPLGTLAPGTGAGEVNVAAAVNSTSTNAANANLAPAASTQQGNPAANWSSASWGSASWGSASWGSASWGSASWGSASWGSASWGSASWGSDYWGS